MNSQAQTYPSFCNSTFADSSIETLIPSKYLNDSFATEGECKKDSKKISDLYEIK